MAFGKLSKQIVATNEATVAGTTPLSQLNIATKNADGSTRDFTSVLLDLADKFQGMPDGVEKTALAMEIFGRSGKDLIPLLNQGREGIIELQKKADELGITLSGENVEAFRKYIEASKDLKDSQLAIKMTIGQETIPAITEMNKKLNEALLWLLKLPEPFRGAAVAAAAFGGPVLTAGSAVVAFAANVADLLPHLKSLRSFGKISLAVTLIGAEVALAIALISKEYEKLQEENKKTEQASQDSWAALDAQSKKISEMPYGEARDKLQAYNEEARRNQEEIDKQAEKYEGLHGVWQGFLDFMATIPATMMSTYTFLNDLLVGYWQGVVNWFTQGSAQVGSIMASFVSGIINWFINAYANSVAWAGNLVNGVVNWFVQLPGRVGSFVASMANQISAWFNNAYGAATGAASRIVNGVISWFATLPGRAASAVAGIGGAIAGAISSAAGAVYNAAVNVVNAAVNGLRAAAGHLPGPVRSALGFAKGGLAYLAGGGTGIFQARGSDIIPAMLTPGEFVLRTDAVDEFGLDLLTAMNEGKISREQLASGGGRGGSKVELTQIFQPKQLTPADMDMAESYGRYEIGQKLKVAA